jgi:hypothetical protein
MIQHKRYQNNGPIIDPIQSAADFIGRQAVTVDWYLENMTDATAWWFNELADDCGMDPWMEIDGIDAATEGQDRWIEFTSGRTKRVGPAFQIFVQKKDIPQEVAA